MSRLRTRNRSALAAATLLTVAVAAGLSGCAGAEEDPLRVPTKTTAQTPEPTVTLTPIPSPSTTPGEDPEADVAAAIETYEAYVDASNNVDVTQETTWQPMLNLLANKLKSSTEGSLSELATAGTQLTGDTKILLAELAGQDANRVVLDVCIDISGTDAIDKNGNSLVDKNREPISPMRVRVIPVGDASSAVWKIDHIAFRDDGAGC